MEFAPAHSAAAVLARRFRTHSHALLSLTPARTACHFYGRLPLCNARSDYWQVIAASYAVVKDVVPNCHSKNPHCIQNKLLDVRPNVQFSILTRFLKSIECMCAPTQLSVYSARKQPSCMRCNSGCLFHSFTSVRSANNTNHMPHPPCRPS